MVAVDSSRGSDGSDGGDVVSRPRKQIDVKSKERRCFVVGSAGVGKVLARDRSAW